MRNSGTKFTMNMQKQYIYLLLGLGVLGAAIALAWGLFLRSEPETQAPGSVSFGLGDNRSVTVTTEAENPAPPNATTGGVAGQTIFKIADGAVVAGMFIELNNPTTTLVRYVKQENGHVFETNLDVPGAQPRLLSNTTIPGIVKAHWVQGGNGVVLQYLSAEVTKSVYLGLVEATTTTSAAAQRPTKIQFLPDNILDIAVSPDGANIAYLLRSSGGAAGYIAGADGAGSIQRFALPFLQTTLSWPAAGTLLATTKNSAGIPGMSFSIQASSGVVTPLIYAEGLTATADRAFERVVYQVLRASATAPVTYARDVATGNDYSLSFDPYPEKCVWGTTATSTIYCAAPLQYVPALYLDLWHLGAASVPDSIFVFDLEAGESDIFTTPGSADGGVLSDIVELSLSATERYLGFIDRSSRTLWGVKLEK